MNQQAAFQLVDQKQASTIECLQEILRVNTVVPPGSNYSALVDYLEPQYRALGLETRRVTVPPEHIASILIRMLFLRVKVGHMIPGGAKWRMVKSMVAERRI